MSQGTDASSERDEIPRGGHQDLTSSTDVDGFKGGTRLVVEQKQLPTAM